MFTKEVKYFTNYKPVVIFGEESLIKDYVTLSQDPISNLPARFTICSSLYLDRISTTPNVFQLYNENGKPWFNFGINMNDKLRDNDRTERILLFYHTGKELFLAAKKSNSSSLSVIIKVENHLSNFSCTFPFKCNVPSQGDNPVSPLYILILCISCQFLV